MSCPPHFRRRVTSPIILDLTLDGLGRPAGEKAARRLPVASRRRTLILDDADGKGERGRAPLREGRAARRSVTTGSLGGSASRPREWAQLGKPEVEREEGKGALLSPPGGHDGVDGAEDISRQATPLWETGHETLPAQIALDLCEAYLALDSSQLYRISSLVHPTARHEPPRSSRRRPRTPRSPNQHLSSSPTSSPHPLTQLSPLIIADALPENPLDDDEVSPLFSPEHCTAMHVAHLGAGGSAVPRSPTGPKRISYDVPHEFDAWEAAERCLFTAEAERMDDERVRDGLEGTAGRAEGARRRLEMVRMQLCG